MNRWVFVVVLHELKQAHGRQHRWVSPRWCSPWIERNRTTPRLTHRPHWIMWWGKFLIVSIIGKTKGLSVCCCSEMARISRQSQISTKKHSPGFKHYLLTILSWSLLTSYNQLDAIFGVVTWRNNCAGKRNIHQDDKMKIKSGFLKPHFILFTNCLTWTSLRPIKRMKMRHDLCPFSSNYPIWPL